MDNVNKDERKERERAYPLASTRRRYRRRGKERQARTKKQAEGIDAIHDPHPHLNGPEQIRVKSLNDALIVQVGVSVSANCVRV